MPLTVSDSDLSQLSDVGYVVYSEVFSLKDMAELERVFDAFNATMIADLKASGGSSGISRADEITFNDHLAERDEAIMAFTKRPEFVEVCTKTLGPDVDLYWNQTVFKQPETARVFPWHQDDAYTPVSPSPYLTIWLAISDATVENGCISVLPGSHKAGLVEHSPSDLGWVCHSNDDPDQGLLVPIPAGSMIVFWSTTMHKSGPNVSTGVHKAFVIQYSASPLIRLSDGAVIEGLTPVARGGQPV